MESRTSGRPRVSIGSEPQAGVRATRQLANRLTVEHELKTVLTPIKEQVRGHRHERGATAGHERGPAAGRHERGAPAADAIAARAQAQS